MKILVARFSLLVCVSLIVKSYAKIDPKAIVGIWLFNEGIMDDVGLFNVALTENEINTIMKQGLRETATAVSTSGKLANVWGSIKAQSEKSHWRIR
ncbi:TPA: hypothetical protein EYP66_24225 [Candidatus Poribacteria bacterium]|nr:hypothetical protein [Candidatus Poribacteria bacterium]